MAKTKIVAVSLEEQLEVDRPKRADTGDLAKDGYTVIGRAKQGYGRYQRDPNNRMWDRNRQNLFE